MASIEGDIARVLVFFWTWCAKMVCKRVRLASAQHWKMTVLWMLKQRGRMTNE